MNILINLLFIKNKEEFNNKLKTFENFYDDKIIIENINEILNVNNIIINNYNNITNNNNIANNSNFFNNSNKQLENLFSEYLNISKIYFPSPFIQLKIIDNFSYKNKLNNDEIWDCVLSNTKNILFLI